MNSNHLDAQRHLETFTDHAAGFTAIVDAVPEGGWTAATPCPGWTAADVVDHVVDTQRDFLSRHGLASPERPGGSPAEVWTTHLAEVLDRAGDPSVLATEYDGWFGPTTIGATLAEFYGTDLIMHRWDLARSAGLAAPFSDAEMQLLEDAYDGWGEAMYSESVFGPAVPVPEDAPRQDRLLGRAGRHPQWPEV